MEREYNSDLLRSPTCSLGGFIFCARLDSSSHQHDSLVITSDLLALTEGQSGLFLISFWLPDLHTSPFRLAFPCFFTIHFFFSLYSNQQVGGRQPQKGEAFPCKCILCSNPAIWALIDFRGPLSALPSVHQEVNYLINQTGVFQKCNVSSFHSLSTTWARLEHSSHHENQPKTNMGSWRSLCCVLHTQEPSFIVWPVIDPQGPFLQHLPGADPTL